MSRILPHWIDRLGVKHRLRLSQELSPQEHMMVSLLRQQTHLVTFALEAGVRAPAFGQAAPNMMRIMVRILLPQVAEAEIATFDSRAGNDLLIEWWAISDPDRSARMKVLGKGARPRGRAAHIPDARGLPISGVHLKLANWHISEAPDSSFICANCTQKQRKAADPNRRG